MQMQAFIIIAFKIKYNTIRYEKKEFKVDSKAE